jgi:hypothetical protein
MEESSMHATPSHASTIMQGYRNVAVVAISLIASFAANRPVFGGRCSNV